jgi:hypothetical protein
MAMKSSVSVSNRYHENGGVISCNGVINVIMSMALNNGIMKIISMAK